MKSYADKLKDPRWQKKRLEVLEAAGWTCDQCQEAGKTLNVHHDYYLPGKEPWEYELDMLRALCNDCHTKEHADWRALHDLVTAGMPLDTLLSFAYCFTGCPEIRCENDEHVGGICLATGISRADVIDMAIERGGWLSWKDLVFVRFFTPTRSRRDPLPAYAGIFRDKSLGHNCACWGGLRYRETLRLPVTGEKHDGR
jgi:hypothetical protein